mgnify:CR=1 FL=1
MKTVYVIQGHSTGCNGGIIHWADSAYFDEKEANELLKSITADNKNDPNYLAYVVGPIPLN